MNKENRFQKFIHDRNEKSDWSNYVSSDGAHLVRQRIIEECGFSRSSLYQNKIVKDQLSWLEVELKSRGILKIKSDSIKVQPNNEIGSDEKMHELSSRVAAIQLRIEALANLINEARNAGLRSSGD